MSEWIGWPSRLRRAIYARMEELSFRTGAATVAGVLAVAATAILLTLIQVGHHAAQHASAAPSSFVVAPPLSAFSPSATHSHRRSRTAAPIAIYVPPRSPTATPQPSPSPSSPSPRRTPRRYPPGTSSPGTPGWPGFPSPPFSWWTMPG